MGGRSDEDGTERDCSRRMCQRLAATERRMVTDCEGQMRRGDDVVEMEEVQRSNIRRRQGPRNRNGNRPTKQAIPQHQRMNWASSRDMGVIQRENHRPIMAKVFSGKHYMAGI